MKNVGGFTFMELMLGLALMVIMLGASYPIYTSFQTFRVLDTAKEEMIIIIRLAHARALAGEGNANHGVSFGPQQYTLYRGPSYAQRTVSFDQVLTLPEEIQLSGLGEVNFALGTGWPSATGSITLTHDINTVVDTITINSEGFVY